MDHLAVTARIPLPEPLSPGYGFVRHDGRRGVAVGRRTGQLWLLDIDPRARTCEPRPLAIHLPRSSDGRGWNVHVMSGSHALERLLLWSRDHQPRVYAIPSGELVAALPTLPGPTLCLSPDGRWVISVGEGRGGTLDLDAGEAAWSETFTFHHRERDSDGELEGLALHGVQSVVALPCADGDVPEGEEHFWLAAGCYGVVVTHRVDALHGLGELRRIPGQTRIVGDLVYDPTDVLWPAAHRHVLVWHGHGCGLAAIDPATGQLHHCWVRGRGQQPYGFFSGVLACGTAPVAWAPCGDGDFLWRVGQPPVPVPAPPDLAMPIALYPDALLCLSVDGGELLWCSLPDAAGE
ncbi:hypothetical protein [Longimicrobium sp.]|uniref:hypothetical protein n=1 Tax=Longimicrobium sp. TaxID=2029185 RepID=UPI003B3B847C